MKKTTARIALILGLVLICQANPSAALAGSESVFVPEIERAVDRAVEAWEKNNPKGLKAALERLTLNETYLMAVGKSRKERSYLARVPASLVKNFNQVGAYLFLIRKEREGISLWPVSFFEGKRFQFQKGGAR